MEIDLNCDLGEGCPHDAELMTLITSANISCGFHAGDVNTCLAALRLAKEHEVQVGAHPGYADREHFGRRELDRSADDIYHLCLYQVGALQSLARACGVPVAYLKPHGALYNQACRTEPLARAVVRAAESLGLPLMGLPGSQLEALSVQRCPFIPEGFADRRYLPDGSLVPRSRPDALVHDPEEAVAQAERLMQSQHVRTLCVHGDNPQAVAFVRRLREGLDSHNIHIHRF
jgi:UPF0271 protein